MSLGSVVLNKLQQFSFNNLFRKVFLLSLLKLLFISWHLGLSSCTSDDIQYIGQLSQMSRVRTPLLLLVLFETFVNILSNIDGLEATRSFD